MGNAHIPPVLFRFCSDLLKKMLNKSTSNNLPDKSDGREVRVRILVPSMYFTMLGPVHRASMRPGQGASPNPEAVTAAPRTFTS
ncbi:hypothetical protein AVEN_16254-1 [Araneus ventricosus]|uniref:Uncharacterized protein n=1 Tax=Araneus ventricosus TaxID=182803 RepID=A0A4Y2P4H0_ARAVE|nr:hypothetical protein AVEN_16254-1 [Araneus ventricosus]